MSKPSLFAEMDTIADSIRENDPDIRAAMRDELQMEFRQLQKRRMPNLSKEEFLDLFETWLLRDLSRMVAARDKALSNVLAAIEEAAARDEPSIFLCRCGVAIPNPFDPEMIRVHQSHMMGHWHDTD